ncbi:hypothetical protein [Yersinia aldovae]|uniref:hypothetical protein n=1 Tax=Yersinia aldovae TaxID=29483 RepID=UPI0005ACECD7|nr:hypothetical protein [Yersinia aldovae]AJJ63991.1 hypothetical protein AT01_1697 [Yersinia aldovae 670-83]
MARTKGSVITVCNKETKHYLNDYWDYEELPDWIDDCICGALGQAGKDTRLSPYRFFRALQALETLSTITVRSYFDRKKVMFDDDEKGYCDTTIKNYTNVLKVASKAIAHHRLNPINNKFRGSRGSILEQQAITPPEIAMQQLVISSVKASDVQRQL